MPEPLSALVIDDELHVRVFLRTLLKAAGAGEVLEADNGSLGKELYVQHQPALVLLDLNMAGQTGLETLNQIIEFDPDATVIIVTAQNERETVLECARRGAAGFFLKRRPKEELLATLREFLTEPEDGE